MITRTSWDDFKKNGLLWAVNCFLHLLGYAIVFQYEDGEIVDVYPARVKFRGFSEKVNTDGYIAVSKYMVANANELLEEANEDAGSEAN